MMTGMIRVFLRFRLIKKLRFRDNRSLVPSKGLLWHPLSNPEDTTLIPLLGGRGGGGGGGGYRQTSYITQRPHSRLQLQLF